MPLLKKEILPEDRYAATSRNGRVVRMFDSAYQDRLVDTANRMLANGLRIPAPFAHAKSAVPQTDIEINQGTPASPYNNAGYWSFFVKEPNEQNKPTLYGYIDLPGSDTDTNSPYYKAKNTAKEVSMSIQDSYVDGLGRVWKDAIMHVALVNHPVVPNQKEFEDVPDDAFILNMSLIEEGQSDPYKETESLSLISQLKTALADKGIILPGDCSPKTILRDILVAVSQRSFTDATSLDVAPVYMSSLGETDMPLTLDQAKALVATNTVNPATSKPFTMEDLGFKPAPPASGSLDMSALQSQLAEKDQKINALTSVVQMLKNTATSRIKADIQNRLSALKARGVPESVISNLQPQVEFQMSVLPDGNCAPHPLEITLSTLEASFPTTVGAPAPAQNFGGGMPLANPFSGIPADLSEDEMNKSVDEIIRALT